MGNESPKIKVIELYQSCSACPAQWEGKTADDNYIYVRYRWGRLSIGTAKSLPAAVFSPNIVDKNVGDGLDGYIPYEELVALTQNKVDWLPPDKVKDGRIQEGEAETNESAGTSKEQG